MIHKPLIRKKPFTVKNRRIVYKYNGHDVQKLKATLKKLNFFVGNMNESVLIHF